MSAGEKKRNRDSQLHDVCTDKRPCLNDSDVTDTDADATIISSQEIMSSTVMDTPPPPPCLFPQASILLGRCEIAKPGFSRASSDTERGTQEHVLRSCLP